VGNRKGSFSRFFFSFLFTLFLSLFFAMSTSPLSRNRDPTSSRGSVLVVRNLTARAGGTPILEDVCFSLQSGKKRSGNDDNDDDGNSTNGTIAFIRGPSGGGKTALLRTLASLEPVDEVREDLDEIEGGGERETQRKNSRSKKSY